MPKGHPRTTSAFGRTIRKFFLSAFVVITFAAYAIHERLTRPDSSLSALPPTPSAVAGASGIASIPATPLPPTNVPTLAPIPTFVPTEAPTATPQVLPSPTTVAQAQGQYKDGTYDGPTVDVFYGLVQVEAQIQNGQISAVQFLQYPNDRRTSVRINNIAMPYLQQEAIQAQTANVNIISGATLTSEGFIMSLGNALNSAHN